MHLFTALTVAMIFACLGASYALKAGNALEGRPRLLSMEVIHGRAEMMKPPKFSEAVRVHVVEDGVVRVLARVEGLDTLELLVSINSRTNVGRFPGHSLGEGLIAIDVTLPDVGSQWPSPGPGVVSPMQTVTIDREQLYLLQVTGDAGIDALGHRTMLLSPPVLVIRGK